MEKLSDQDDKYFAIYNHNKDNDSLNEHQKNSLQ